MLVMIHSFESRKIVNNLGVVSRENLNHTILENPQIPTAENHL